VARRIHDVTAQPFEISGTEVRATVSIGVALSASAHARVEDLLLDADAAMYRAKAQGRARSVVFDVSLRERRAAPVRAGRRAAPCFAARGVPRSLSSLVDVASGRIQGLEL